jgi:hypothetical protein
LPAVGVLDTIEDVNANSRAIASRFALAGVLMPVWLLGFATLLGATRSDYDPFRDAISELGADGAASPLLWQIAGFGVAAALELAYALALRREFGRGWLVGLSVVVSIALVASAGAPCDPGCPPVPASGKMAVHTIAGLSVFLAMVLLPIAGWRAFRRRGPWIGTASVSLGFGIVLGVLFVIGPMLGPDRIGIWQRAFLTTFAIWQGIVAWRLDGRLRSRASLRTAEA